MKLTCIIIDDEPLARQLLAHFANQTDGVQVIGSYDNAGIFLENIKDYNDNLDIVFLDLQMRQQTGVEVLEQIKWSNIKVVITSAYPASFLQNLHLPYFEWLQKPIRYETFVATLEKVWEEKVRNNN